MTITIPPQTALATLTPLSVLAGLRGRLNWLPPGWFRQGWILEWFTQESTLDEMLHLVTNCFKDAINT